MSDAAHWEVRRHGSRGGSVIVLVTDDEAKARGVWQREADRLEIGRLTLWSPAGVCVKAVSAP